MASELLGTLKSRRSAVEKGGETWESAPKESEADASHLTGLEFGKAPAAAEWLAQKSDDVEEEDTVCDAVNDVLKTRGSRPAHAPGPVTSDDADRINKLADELMALQRKRLEEKGQLDEEKQNLAKRAAEVDALEEELRREKELKQRREEELKNYPRPSWLETYEGTINVAVSGNSGVGKSLLINRIRRLKPGHKLWAATGVVETTMEPTMYTFPGVDHFRLWDLPGANTDNFPLEDYIRTMGLRYFDSVLIITAGRFTSTEVELRQELKDHGVPYVMVRTKVDIDVSNNHSDNSVSEAETLTSIRGDLLQQHGVDKAYLVSSRDPEMYDMPLLLKEVFPGFKKALDANAPVFDPGDSSGWGDAWSLPSVPLATLSPLLAGIQGQWQDACGESMFVIEGNEAHVTLADGQAAVMTLTQDDRGIWWNNRWVLDQESIEAARSTGELRWKPADLTYKPFVWRWTG